MPHPNRGNMKLTRSGSSSLILSEQLSVESDSDIIAASASSHEQGIPPCPIRTQAEQLSLLWRLNTVQGFSTSCQLRDLTVNVSIRTQVFSYSLAITKCRNRHLPTFFSGLPWYTSGGEPAYQCRRLRFHPWVGKIPWRREWQPTPVFFPEKSHGQGSPVGYSSRGHKRVGHELVNEQLQNFFRVFKNRLNYK